MAIQTFDEARNGDFLPFNVYIGDRAYEGYFSNIRIDRKSVPEGWYVYDIRDCDSDGEPCEIKNGYIMVNHFGTFSTQNPLPLDEGESLNAYDDGSSDFEYSFI